MWDCLSLNMKGGSSGLEVGPPSQASKISTNQASYLDIQTQAMREFFEGSWTGDGSQHEWFPFCFEKEAWTKSISHHLRNPCLSDDSPVDANEQMSWRDTVPLEPTYQLDEPLFFGVAIILVANHLLTWPNIQAKLALD